MEFLNKSLASLKSAVHDVKETLVASHHESKFGWELDENVLKCRDCQVEFSLITRRHHCRSCGSVIFSLTHLLTPSLIHSLKIYCETCSHYMISKEDDGLRACIGCCRSQTPGEKIRKIIESKHPAVMTNINAGDYIKLSYGSEYDPDMIKSNANVPSAAAKYGYFELVNKSEYFIAVKILNSGNVWNEILRPPYTPLPPNECLFGHFADATNHHSESLKVILLVGNPNVALEFCDYNPMGLKKLSPCADVKNFEHVVVFDLFTLGKNCLLKYIGDCCLEPRKGKNIAIKTIGSFLSTKPRRPSLDYSTNITKVDKIIDSVHDVYV